MKETRQQRAAARQDINAAVYLLKLLPEDGPQHVTWLEPGHCLTKAWEELADNRQGHACFSQKPDASHAFLCTGIVIPISLTRPDWLKQALALVVAEHPHADSAPPR